MKINKSLVVTLCMVSVSGVLAAQEKTTDGFTKMFKEAKVSGQLRAMYAGYDQKKSGVRDSYATAIGGKLKYELAKLNGFNAGVAVYTSNDIPSASGDGNAHNSELSSSKGNYTTIGEAYLNYTHKNFNFRAGRQKLDTPLADSDDTRMIQNSFEAYVASYDLSGFNLMAGRINNWQGVDVDLDNGWSSTAKNGTNFAGVSYDDIYEFDAWFYNFTDSTNASYFDMGINYSITKELNLHTMVQFLNENELSNSNYDTNVYGGLLELTTGGFGVNFAYNSCDASNGKKVFLGLGGGAFFTSMDTMTIDVVAEDRKVQALVSTISYDYNNFNLLYAYGDFNGNKNSQNIKAHIVEQDITLEYNINDKFIVSGVYVLKEDRQNSVKTENDWNRAQLKVEYNF